MCESEVRVPHANGTIEEIADDALYITQKGEGVDLRWLLKEPRRMAGRIIAVDAVEHTVTMEISEPSVKEEGPDGAEEKPESAQKTSPLPSH